MDKLIKYRKRFVDFCFENGVDINKVRRDKTITVYEMTPAEAWRHGTPFLLQLRSKADVLYHDIDCICLDCCKSIHNIAHLIA